MVLVFALLLGYILVDAPLLAFVSVCGVVWCVTLPNHGRLGVCLCISLAQSALIIPFLPGPIYVAEAAALLTISAVPLIVVFKNYSEDTGWLFQRNKLLFLGLLIYGITLVGIVMIRGVSSGALGGGGQGGAKVYFRQFVYGLVPILFLFVSVKEKSLMKLVALYFLMPLTFLVSELALVFAPTIAAWIVAFLALPTDSLFFNDSASSLTFRLGFRRLQSLFLVCPNLVFFLMVCFSARTVLGRRSAVLIPTILGLLILGLASGHRATLIQTGLVLVVIAVIQRVFNARNVLLLSMGLLLGAAFIYGSISHLPAAMQRAVSFLPGLDIDTVVAVDAKGTWDGRIEVTKRGIELIPQYFWLGRGFTRYTDIVPYSLEDVNSTEFALLQGHFLNGFVGSLVNTGIWGAIGISIFLLGGAALAVRVLKQSRYFGFEDPVSRIGCVISSLYLVNVAFFYIAEGDVDGALKRFGVHIGILFACERIFRRKRLLESRDSSGIDAAESEPEIASLDGRLIPAATERLRHGGE